MADDAPAMIDRANNIYVAPVRHHSPACAWHLRALVEAVAPSAILIEGPVDFEPLIPSLTDPATRTPVAIVAISDRGDGAPAERRAVSYFPFCSHSPEYVAVHLAHARGIPARFIDLPSQDRAMTGEADRDGAHLIDEKVFNSSAYVKALMAALRCRDGNEVWDHLFETRFARGDWVPFFADVGLYCQHLRDCTATSVMEADGTLAREVQMRACIAEARAAHDGPIVVVVGGFHAAAVLDGTVKPGKPVAAKGQPSAYVIRYGNRQLNALSGYAAGLPLPAYYESVWNHAAAGNPFDAVATELITGFSVHLRTSLPAFAPPIPVLAATLESASRLATLRGRPGPLRDDILDACRSTLLKGEEGGDGHPLIAELMAWMTGSALGDVPASAGSPPLVEAARAQGRTFGFIVTDGERRNREFDIYRNEKHRRASQFLHAMTFLETDFGRRMSGPDLRSGVDLDRLHETWSVAWSPLVEARLIELSALADRVATAVVAVIANKVQALHASGKGHDAVAAIDLFVVACQAGVAREMGGTLSAIADEVANDPSLENIAAALRDLIGLWRNRGLLGIEDDGAIEMLMTGVWRRALHLVPDLAHASEDGVTSALSALTILREAMELAAGEIAAIDSSLFDEAIADLVVKAEQPALSGAIHALACLSGHVTPEELGARAAGGLSGAYVNASDKAAFLRGVIAISRELIWGIPALVTDIDGVMAGLDDDGFVALLPHLRLAFGQLDPREIDRLAQLIAERRGGAATDLAGNFSIPESEIAAMLAVDRGVARELALAGLA
jgi:hypothetical protein